jgi:hypothetical protein
VVRYSLTKRQKRTKETQKMNEIIYYIAPYAIVISYSLIAIMTVWNTIAIERLTKEIRKR